MRRVTLLISCEDKKGIIASVTNFIKDQKGNIVYVDQHVDRIDKLFFMRLECEFTKDSFELNRFQLDFKKSMASEFEMSWKMYDTGIKPKMAIFVSKYQHCLYDILGRYKAGELKVEIPLIISNHPDLKHIAESFDIPYHYFPMNKDNKMEVEKKQLELLNKAQIDFVVLARYMQILSSRVIERYPNDIINIHHSFLPAFPGAKPYHSAYNRGVKIIGATSHYVTEDLDEGPIIEQDTVRVSHTNTISDFILKGRDLEKIVLSRGINLHVNRKVLVYKNKTVVFN